MENSAAHHIAVSRLSLATHGIHSPTAEYMILGSMWLSVDLISNVQAVCTGPPDLYSKLEVAIFTYFGKVSVSMPLCTLQMINC